MWSDDYHQVSPKRSWRSNCSRSQRWTIWSSSLTTRGEFICKDSLTVNKRLIYSYMYDTRVFLFQPLPSPLCKGLYQLQKPRGYSPLQRSLWWICIHWQQRYITLKKLLNRFKDFRRKDPKFHLFPHDVYEQVRSILPLWSFHLFKKLPRKEVKKRMQSVEQLSKVNIFTLWYIQFIYCKTVCQKIRKSIIGPL